MANTFSPLGTLDNANNLVPRPSIAAFFSSYSSLTAFYSSTVAMAAKKSCEGRPGYDSNPVFWIMKRYMCVCVCVSVYNRPFLYTSVY